MIKTWFVIVKQLSWDSLIFFGVSKLNSNDYLKLRINFLCVDH